MLTAANVNNCRAKKLKLPGLPRLRLCSWDPPAPYLCGITSCCFLIIKARRTTVLMCWVFRRLRSHCSSPVNVIYLKISRSPGRRERPPPPHNAPRFDERHRAPLHGTATAVCHVYSSEQGLDTAFQRGLGHVNKHKLIPCSPPEFHFTVNCKTF